MHIACDRCEILPQISLINGYENCIYISGIKSYIPTWEEHAINEFDIKRLRSSLTRRPHAQTPTSVGGKRYSAWSTYPDDFNLNHTHWEAIRPLGKMQRKLGEIKTAVPAQIWIRGSLHRRLYFSNIE